VGDDQHSPALRQNLLFYDALWDRVRLATPERFNTWPLVLSLAEPGLARLEVAPGLRPRLPIVGTRFVDASIFAVEKLRASGANAEVGLVSDLPYADGAFGLVAAFDVVEHVDDDDGALAELVRVLSPGGTLVLAVPLHASRWTRFDDVVGHRHRYEPTDLASMLQRHGLSVLRTAVYGMLPRSSVLIALGVFWLTRLRRLAFWWYDRVLFLVGARFLQKPLHLVEGMMDVSDVDEVLLVCRKAQSSV
jgi:SAM-dependent methyltransferase